MKREEKIAESYFNSIGHKNLIFEPKGNRTPDFELDSDIGIEVRRLNQFHNEQPIEKTYFNVIPSLINLVQSYGDGNHQKTSFVTFSFSRPLKVTKEIKSKLVQILNEHELIIGEEKSYKISNRLSIDFFPSEKRLEHQFFWGATLDENEGGIVLSNIYKSLKLIVDEKSELIKPFKNEYKKWWLALIDNIGNGLSEKELKELSSNIDFDLVFDKVFIISNIPPHRGGEL